MLGSTSQIRNPSFSLFSQRLFIYGIKKQPWCTPHSKATQTRAPHPCLIGQHSIIILLVLILKMIFYSDSTIGLEQAKSLSQYLLNSNFSPLISGNYFAPKLLKRLICLMGTIKGPWDKSDRELMIFDNGQTKRASGNTRHFIRDITFSYEWRHHCYCKVGTDSCSFWSVN